MPAGAYGYRRVGYVLANTLQLHAYDGRYHETNKRWSSTIFIPEDGGHRHTFLIGSHPAVLDGFVSDYRAELEQLQANSNQAMSMGEMTM